MMMSAQADLKPNQENSHLTNMRNEQVYQHHADSAFSLSRPALFVPSAQQHPKRKKYRNRAPQESPLLPTFLPQRRSSPQMRFSLSEEREGSFVNPSSDAAFYSQRAPIACGHHDRCSCNECAHRYWHKYHRHHRNHVHERCETPALDHPSIRRRISSDTRQELSRSPYLPHGGYERESSNRLSIFRDRSGVDANDREVEMITSRHFGNIVHPYSLHPHEQGHWHEPIRDVVGNALPYPNHPPYYHPYPYPYVHPYPHPAHDAFYRVGDRNTHYYNMHLSNSATRKRKSHDEFLLRPRKDYIIYADRSESPRSDITASPTPSLDSFDIPEIKEICQKEEETLEIDTGKPVIGFANTAPRIERNSSGKTTRFDFSEKPKTGIVRIVSPIKPKTSEDKSVEELSSLPKTGTRDDHFIAISDKELQAS